MMDKNLLMPLCYVPVVGWMVSVVVFLTNKNKTLKWHAVQSLLLSAVVWLVAWFVPVFWLGGFVVRLVLVVMIYQGQTVKLPVLSSWADKICK